MRKRRFKLVNNYLGAPSYYTSTPSQFSHLRLSHEQKKKNYTNLFSQSYKISLGFGFQLVTGSRDDLTVHQAPLTRTQLTFWLVFFLPGNNYLILKRQGKNENSDSSGKDSRRIRKVPNDWKASEFPCWEGASGGRKRKKPLKPVSVEPRASKYLQFDIIILRKINERFFFFAKLCILHENELLNKMTALLLKRRTRTVSKAHLILNLPSFLRCGSRNFHNLLLCNIAS